MVELFNLVFTNFWTFIGTWILLSCIVTGVLNLIKVITKNPVLDVDITYEKEKEKDNNDLES